jgi:hypothetical protein
MVASGWSREFIFPIGKLRSNMPREVAAPAASIEDVPPTCRVFRTSEQVNFG